MDKFFLKEQKQKFNNTKGKQERGAAGHTHFWWECNNIATGKTV